ncbi:MAG: hypothetical protein ACKO3I_01875 [Synechococcales cyanobacterium]
MSPLAVATTRTEDLSGSALHDLLDCPADRERFGFLGLGVSRNLRR